MEAYFDNSATTRCFEEVKDIVVKTMMEDFGNPSAMHQKGVDAEGYVKESARTLAQILKVTEKEILFTSGGTESNNLALIGGALANKRSGNHIITTAVEHAAVSQPVAFLQEQGFEVTILPVDGHGVVKLDALEKALRPDTILVSTMMVNNETGAVMPVEKIGAMIQEKCPKALYHVDAIQAFGKYRIYPKKAGIDMLSVSSHKIHGPKGVGFLYAKKGIRLHNIIEGGAQERGKRAGTENIPGIVGMAAALKEAVSNLAENSDKVTAMRDTLIEGLSKVPHCILNGDKEHRLPGNVNFCFEGIEGESLLLLLDMKGICASSGSACTSGSLDPSHVLLAIGRPHEIAHGSLRLSICEYNTPEEMRYICEKVPEVVEYLRNMSPVWRDLKEGRRKYVIQ